MELPYHLVLGFSRKPAVNRQSWATANGGRHKAMRPGRGVAEWHMLPSWNSLHTLLVAALLQPGPAPDSLRARTAVCAVSQSAPYFGILSQLG